MGFDSQFVRGCEGLSDQLRPRDPTILLPLASGFGRQFPGAIVLYNPDVTSSLIEKHVCVKVVYPQTGVIVVFALRAAGPAMVHYAEWP
jgi:hypothetical protein